MSVKSDEDNTLNLLSDKSVYEKKISAQETTRLFSIYSSASDNENILNSSDQKGYCSLFFPIISSKERA
jgi:hypothetical protein